MKPRLQTSLGQQLVLTPQLRQALHLLQLSSLELEAEITTAVESNPLLDWDEAESAAEVPEGMPDIPAPEAPVPAAEDASDTPRDSDEADWEPPDSWNTTSSGSGSGSGGDEDGLDPMDRLVHTESLHDHLSWQLRLTRLSARDMQIGAALIDAIEDDGYLREPLDEIAQTLRPEIDATPAEILTVLRQIQRFDPLGVAPGICANA